MVGNGHPGMGEERRGWILGGVIVVFLVFLGLLG